MLLDTRPQGGRIRCIVYTYCMITELCESGHTRNLSYIAKSQCPIRFLWRSPTLIATANLGPPATGREEVFLACRPMMLQGRRIRCIVYTYCMAME